MSGPFRHLAAALSIVFWAAPALADAVQVRAAPHADYGRIVFGWPAPVAYKAEVQGTRLVVSFGRAIEGDVAAAVRALPKYLKGATLAPDGRSVSFALAGESDVGAYDQGNSVVIDIYAKKAPGPASKSAAAPTQPPPPAVPAKPVAETLAATPSPASGNLPKVSVRAGQHADKTRIVFDWTESVPYTFAKQGGTVTLDFRKPADLDLGRLQGRPPRFIGGAVAQPSAAGTTVVMTVPPDSEVKHFLSGSKVVVDVLAPKGPVPDLKPPSAPATRTAATPPVAEPPPAPAPAPPPAAAPAPAPVAVAPPAPAVVPPPPAVAPAPVAVAPAAAEPPPPQAAAPAPAADPAKPMSLVPAAPAGERKEEGAPSAASGSSEPTFTISERKDDNAGAAAGPITGPVLRVEWDQPVSAAVFRRAGTLWIVFDKPAQIDTAKLAQEGGNLIRNVEQVPIRTATVLRIATVAGINPIVRRDGLTWLFELRQARIPAQTPLDVKAQPKSPVGPRILLTVPEPGQPIPVTDPEVGDNIVIVPVIPLGHGILQAYRYPQAELPATIQGIVIAPLTDNVRVRSSRQGVEVSSPDGLALSEVSAEAEAMSKIGPMRELTRVMDLAKFKQVELKNYIADRQALLADVAKAGPKDREKPRLALARFYLANGFGPEARGTLDLVAGDRAEIEKDAEFRMMRGAASYLLQHYGDAQKDLADPILDKYDEAKFWRAAARAQMGDRAGAAAELKATGAIVRPYPKALSIPLALLVAEASADSGDVKQGNHQVEAMNTLSPSPMEKAQIAYVDGRLKDLAGDFDAAVAKWEEAIKGPHRPTRVKAIRDRAELLLKLKKITRKDAIEIMEKLRFAWRGDDFEFNLLRRLGSIYIEDKDFRSGLRTLRQAATYFRTHPKAPEVTQQMADTFNFLYLDNGADAIPPISAIALFDEFKELTPVGAKGDEMIRKLADRLVAVDLLDRAAELLKGQVEFRLKGAEKARVGAQLALVHLLNRKYDEAIDVIAKTGESGLPQALTEQRRHLAARALLAREDVDGALEMLKDDKSLDAELLRAETYWEGEDWTQASLALQQVVKLTGAQVKKPLEPKQADYIFNLAIATTLAGNERGAQRLRRDFGPTMAQTRYKNAFDLITAPNNLGVLDFRQVPAEVKQAQGFQTFMANYQQRLREQKLSGIN